MPQNASSKTAGLRAQASTSPVCRALPSPGERFKDAPKELALTDKLKAVTRPVMVQVAPHKFVPFDQQTDSVPEVTLCRWNVNTDGTYFPMPFEERLIRLDRKLLKQLNLVGQYQTIRRLGQMGCVELVQIAPRVILFNLSSWFNHLRRCAENPYIWDEGSGYIEEYRKTTH